MSNKSQKKNAASRYGFLPDVEYLENYFALFDSFDADAQKSMPYRLEGLMFVATVCGTCHFTVDLKEHILHPNELLLVLPGQMVQHVDKSADFQGRFMFMSSELLANISTRKKNFSVFFALRDNPGNILYHKDSEGKYRFALVDINRFYFGHPTMARCMRSFTQLSGARLSQLVVLIRRYCDVRHWDPKRAWKYFQLYRRSLCRKERIKSKFKSLLGLLP